MKENTLIFRLGNLVLFCGILIVFLFLVSCGNSTNTINYVSDSSFRTGNSGLTIEFLKNGPPEKILEDSPTDVAVVVHNEGAYNITNGYLSLSYDKDYLVISSTNQKTFNLEGKNKYNRLGQEKTLVYSGKTAFLDSESQRRDVPLVISACYQYKTILDDLICIDAPTNLGAEKGTPVCTYQAEYSYSGQGAPVQISGVKLLMLNSDSSSSSSSYKPIIEFTISHSSGITQEGAIIDYDNYRNGCFGSSTQDFYNKVKVSAKLSDFKLDCNKNEVVLRDGTAIVRCTAQNIDAVVLPYKAPLVIELNYGYLTTKSFTTQVIRG